MKTFPISVLIAILTFTVAAGAQDQCEGPQELCAQVLQLKSELESHKQNAESGAKDSAAALRAQQQYQETKAIQFVGAMSTLAVVLKILLSLLANWKDTLFKSDRGKAAIRIAILVVTLCIFLATNMGFGIPWWQAMILAAGGPLSMVLHEMMKLVPVVRGKSKMPDEEAAPQA
jgi:amino acid transporter